MTLIVASALGAFVNCGPSPSGETGALTEPAAAAVNVWTNRYDNGRSGANTHENLAGNYSSFVSDVGVDDETANRGSVMFQVWRDGVQAYDSGVVTGGTAALHVELSVAGVQELRLVVTDGGNGNGYDHADWADARVK